MNDLLSPDQVRDLQERQWTAEGPAWLKEGRRIASEISDLQGAVETIMWRAGDWLNRGKDRFGDRYKIAAEIFDRAVGTLRTAASVAGRIEACRRRYELSFDHHREVAPLKGGKEQDRFLALAVRHGWSVKELREQIRAAGADQEAGQTIALGNGSAFVPAQWALRFMRWAQTQDITSMPSEQKRALRRELEPILAFYQRLGEGLPTPRKESLSAKNQGRCP